jgi:hypothetical protein
VSDPAASSAPSPALVAELSRRTDVCWVVKDAGTRMVWHTWVDDALCVVSGGDEQPLLEVDDGSRVEVVLGSRDTGGRLLTWPGRVSVVRPSEARWVTVTAALVAARLNLPDPDGAPERWAADSVVHRIVPVLG